jgi:MoxR-like ATPase
MLLMDAEELVSAWLDGRARLANDGTVQFGPATHQRLPAKFRKAYQWICSSALLSPFAELESGTPRRFQHGDVEVELFDEPGYSSFALLPLLNLMTSRRMVFLGAPGRGKTSMATLMGLLAGHSLEAIRRAVQHGHPQLTVQDLLGHPLPHDLLEAHSARDIRVAWRDWIRLRVKIVDEYNRIPTKTQSALLSLMAEGYAEMYEQVIHTDTSAWFLTANDDLGGGTFPVIDALKDRIDLVVRCTPFHSQHLAVLAERIASAHSAEEFVPGDLVFGPEELDLAAAEVRAIPVPEDVLQLLGFFLGQLDFCRRASDRLEYMNKDTLHLAGRRVGHVCTEDCPLDKHENLCSQTDNGVSPRAFQAVVHFAKALAYFRDQDAVGLDDLRQILPWTLFDKLKLNAQSAFFQKLENKVLLTDRVSWIRQLFDRAVQQYAAYEPVRRPLLVLEKEAAEAGLIGSMETEVRLRQIRAAMENLLRHNELNGPVYEDLVRLKHLHNRYLHGVRSRPGVFD